MALEYSVALTYRHFMGYFQFLDVANVIDIPIHVFWYIYVCINVVYTPKNGMTGS